MQATSLRTKNAWERFQYQISFRLDTSKHQQETFYLDALRTVGERAKVVLVQGFGRFGLFGPRAADSTRRFDLRQDWGALFWLPFVCFGFFESVRLGRQQLAAGKPPLALLLLVWAVSAWAVVTCICRWPGTVISFRLKAATPCWRRWVCAPSGTESPRGVVCELSLRGLELRAFLRKPAALGLPHPAGKQRLLLAFARLEYREPADARVLTGRPGHGVHQRAGGSNRRQGQFQGEYYSDKPPGFPLLARGAVRGLEAGSGRARSSAGRQSRLPYWVADYWVTLFTSGLLTAATGALLVYWSRCLGCGPGRAALVRSGLRPGNAGVCVRHAGQRPPADGVCAYSCRCSCCGRRARARRPVRMFLAGFLAAYAVGDRASGRAGLGASGLVSRVPVPAHASAALTTWLLFGIGGAIPTLMLLGYNQLAFWLALGHGLLSSRRSRICRSAQRAASAGTGVSGIVLGEALEPALGPASRPRFLCADPAAHDPGLGCTLVSRPRKRGGHDDAGGRRGAAGQRLLSGVDRRLVDRAAAAGAAVAVCGAAHRRSCSRASRALQRLRRGSRSSSRWQAASRCSCFRGLTGGFRMIFMTRMISIRPLTRSCRGSGRSGLESLCRGGASMSGSAGT